MACSRDECILALVNPNEMINNDDIIDKLIVFSCSFSSLQYFADVYTPFRRFYIYLRETIFFLSVIPKKWGYYTRNVLMLNRKEMRMGAREGMCGDENVERKKYNSYQKECGWMGCLQAMNIL